MIDVVKFGDWAKLGKIMLTAEARYAAAIRSGLMKEANLLRGHMVRGLVSGAPAGRTFTPLSPITLALRKAGGFGGSKPLIRSGALRGSITVVREGGGSGIGGAVFVGVHRSARGKGGKSLVNIAEIHEMGRTWTMTPTAKSRKFLFAMLKKAGAAPLIGPRLPGRRFTSPNGGRVTIHIPARPFIGPIVDMYGRPEDVRRRFVLHLAAAMGGDFGTP